MHRIARRGIREVGAFPRRRDRHCAADGAGSRQIARAGPDAGRSVHAGAAEAVRRHTGDAVGHSRIAIDVGDVHIPGQTHRAETMAIDSRSIPGTESLKRSQRHPADIAKSESEANAES
jgi:hypothetical protein